MILFYLLLAGIAVVPTLMLLPALKSKNKPESVDRDAYNVKIAQQRIREIASVTDTDEILKREAKLELQATLLEDLKSAEPKTVTTISIGWGLSIILSVPLLALGLYSYLGNPQFAAQSVIRTELTGQETGPPNIDALIEQLEERLIQEPDNPMGWELAANTYMQLGNFRKAETAYEKLNSLVAGNPDFLVSWADATIMVTGSVYTAEARARIEKALSINPNHIDALWIASLGSESLGDHTIALNHLNTLLPLIADDKNTTAQIKLMIDRNRKQGSTDSLEQNLTATDQSAGKIITVEVTIDAEMNSRVKGSDTIFVFAKAANGPPAPLAVSKHQVRQLPLKIELTEQMAMIADMSIGSFDEITVTARVSKSGNPIQQAGDLVSETELVTPKTANQTVSLVIDKIVK